MGYKDILVYLDPTPASALRLTVALEIAAAEGAYVTGVDATADEAFLGDWRGAATQIEPGFHEALKGAGVVGEFHVAGARSRLADFASPVDLVVAPSPSPEHRKLIRAGMPDEVVMQSGAPVLAIPTDWPGGPCGKRVVIAWNASREARRAVRDALPILKRAEEVVVFVFSKDESPLRASALRLATHLARHGVTAHISDWTHTGDVTAIEAMFASLDTQNADLVVAGAFGHSRVFETLFGSVSHDLLAQPVLPVLMSH
ncbi:MAG: universal stress protein [Pseudomonadota bacterium]|nr:universal stress protein [Pseudomonadota bacterium]